MTFGGGAKAKVVRGKDDVGADDFPSVTEDLLPDADDSLSVAFSLTGDGVGKRGILGWIADG